ncbi:MAG TPA: MBL fold metallo-hydrolase [Gemmatimonadaceae bacterium]|nr:MBL fold metallo-hydrolase [Gemmatimonadaceae bacterium]
MNLNNSTIDVVILSHQHLDHYSGLRELFKTSRHIHVRYFFENKDPAPAVMLAELRDSILTRMERDSLIYRDSDDPCSNGRPICTITMNGGAKLHIMAPLPRADGANNRSTAVKLIGPDSASFTM